MSGTNGTNGAHPDLGAYAQLHDKIDHAGKHLDHLQIKFGDVLDANGRRDADDERRDLTLAKILTTVTWLAEQEKKRQARTKKKAVRK